MTKWPGRMVVVGASVASAMLIERSRELGFSGEIVVIDCDEQAPYDRPPLSKQFLLGSGSVEPAGWWPESVPIIRGRAVGLRAQERTVLVELPRSIEEIQGDVVVIAAGAGSVSLPGEPSGVLKLRTAEDALSIRGAVDAGARSAVIIGAGTIGSELASTLCKRGVTVTVVDLAQQPMQRFFSGHLGEEATAWMSQAGVTTRLGVLVESISRSASGWTVQVNGDELTADLVISAVGARPNTEWLTESGLDLANGIRCDAEGRALLAAGGTATGIFAIGDISARMLDDGSFSRFESWTQAQRHGAALAEYFAGEESSELEQAPYGWTEQFGRTIQVHGILSAEGEIAEVLASESQESALYRIDVPGKEPAWIGVNAPRQFARASMGLSRSG